jgi:3-phytase
MKELVSRISVMALLITIVILSSCEQKPKKENTSESKFIQQEIVIHTSKDFDSTKNAEAWEDSLKMAHCLELSAKVSTHFPPKYETPAVDSEENEDAADDPAIWVNKANPEQSLVIGTHKKKGLYVYDLQGMEKQFLPSGSINNVDLRDHFIYNGREVVLVAGSNRDDNTVDLYTLDKETFVLSEAVCKIPSQVEEVYGLCMYTNPTDTSFHVFVNGKDGKVEQYHVTGIADSVEYKLLGTVQMEDQTEGMEADDENQILYIGVEEHGIYKFDVADAITQEKSAMIEMSSSSDNEWIQYDIEGLAVYHANNASYMVVSIQGSFSYAIWKLSNAMDKPDTFMKNFNVWMVEGTSVDGVEETDGLDIVVDSLNADFPNGVLVLQDGFNFEGDSLSTQNFKYVSTDFLLEEFK